MWFSFSFSLWEASAVLCILGALVYYYLTSTYSFWERLGVPYVKPRIFYGNVEEVIRFKKNHFEAFSEFYAYFKGSGHPFGGIFQLRTPALLVCSAELAKDVFVKNFSHFHDREIAHDENFDPLSAHLIALKGEKWKYVRSKLNPAFSTSKLKGMLGAMKEITEGFVENLAKEAVEGQPVELRKCFARYTMTVIAAVAFGLEISNLEDDSKFLEMGRRFFEPTKLERILQTIANSFPWAYKTFKLRMVSEETTDFFTGVLRDTMDHRRKNNIRKNDFLHFLMKIEERKTDGSAGGDPTSGSTELTEGVIAAQAFVFFLAGYETSSSAMSACVHALAHRPDVQRKMMEEVERVSAAHGGITSEAIQDLVYVEQVIEETLRMYPPVGLIIRKCTNAYQIQGTEIVIPEGCQAFIPVYSFHYDPEYFPRPREFRPERFAPEKRKSMIPYSFMPFGHGPRVCIGARLAMMEMKMSMALIIKNFQISTCEKTKPFKIDPTSFFLAPVDGLWVRLVRR